jgi:hypothetical protein
VNWTSRRLGMDDALTYRDIRLEALQTEPASFGSDFAREAGRSEAEWSDQLSRNFTFGVFANDELFGIATFLPEGMEKVRHRAQGLCEARGPWQRREPGAVRNSDRKRPTGGRAAASGGDDPQ